MPELKTDIERREFYFDVDAKKDETRGHMLEGIPIVFGQRADLEWYDEIIEPGALDATDMKDVPFLINHDMEAMPLARSRNNNENSTMQMRVQPDGMHIRVNLDVDRNVRASEAYSAAERGDVSGMSFAFTVADDSWEGLDTGHPIRHIRSISKLFEVSMVTFPAYSGAVIQARSLDSAKASLESAMNELKELREKKQKLALRIRLEN